MTIRRKISALISLQMVFISVTPQCVNAQAKDPALDPYVQVLLNQQSAKQEISHLSEKFTELKSMLSETKTWLQTFQESVNGRINSEVMRSHDDNRSDREKFLGDLKEIRELIGQIKLAMETKHFVFASELETMKNLLQASDTKLSEWIKKTENKLIEWTQVTEKLFTELRTWMDKEVQELKQSFRTLSHQNNQLIKQNEILIRQNEERKIAQEIPTYGVEYILKTPMTYGGFFSIALGMYCALPNDLFPPLTSPTETLIATTAGTVAEIAVQSSTASGLPPYASRLPAQSAPSYDQSQLIADLARTLTQTLVPALTAAISQQYQQPRPFALLSYAVGTNLVAQVAWNVATPYVDSQNQFFTQLTLLCLSAFSVHYLHTQRVPIMKPLLPFLNVTWLSATIITVGGVIAAITGPLSQYINIEKWWSAPPGEKKKDS